MREREQNIRTTHLLKASEFRGRTFPYMAKLVAGICHFDSVTL